MGERDPAQLPQYARLLLAIRKRQRWTQRQLACELMISERTLRAWEHGREPRAIYLPLMRTLLERAAT